MINKGVVKLYTDISKFSALPIVDDCEATFRALVTAKYFTNIDLDVMWRIDSAKLMDRNTGLVKTSFGLTTINNLSTGCKTALLYLHLGRKGSPVVLSLLECGWNAMDVIFSLQQYDCVKMYIQHEDGLINCARRNYLINDEISIDDLVYLQV